MKRPREKKEDKMVCHRCFGFCVEEVLVETVLRTVGLRCLNCGSIVDTRIIENRENFGNEENLKSPSRRQSRRLIGCSLESA